MKRLFLTILYLTIAQQLLTGCSFVQWSPTYECEHVKYERNGNTANVEATGCQV